ncbi:hypothetical protein BpHYR1_015228 [Brachionus plicatilis]|uniref:Uncharacterized protein n=1 Tax=Brachionus plicatilis TaxID=10195 RepID=A0A3M7RC04_BRAPC|nr:hypothetical protein BpHYR1_015228 [Brachionus plicatilis]
MVSQAKQIAPNSDQKWVSIHDLTGYSTGIIPTLSYWSNTVISRLCPTFRSQKMWRHIQKGTQIIKKKTEPIDWDSAKASLISKIRNEENQRNSLKFLDRYSTLNIINFHE